MNPPPLTVMLIGCGNIAGGFDMGIDKHTLPCTHAGAYSRDNRFTLTMCIDPDTTKRQQFMKSWGIGSGYDSLETAKKNNVCVDIISICSPTEHHENDLKTAMSLNPKLIFCEKPLTHGVTQSKSIVNEFAQKNIKLAINYTRRWDPTIEELKESIKQEHYGLLRSIVGFYNKGILNNGSHMLDLLLNLRGNLSVITAPIGTDDFDEDDPTITCLLQDTAGIPIHLVAANANDYSLFECQFIFSEAIITMHDGGSYWTVRKIHDSPRFNGYKSPDFYQKKDGGYQYAMSHAVDNIYKAVTQNEPLRCTGDHGLATQTLCVNILNQFQMSTPHE